MNNVFALQNPLVRLIGKPKEAFTRDDLLKVIVDKEIQQLTFHYTALDGKFKEMHIPITSQKQVERILTDGERIDGSSLYPGMVDVGLSDLYVVSDYKTAFFNPLDHTSLDFICRYLTSEGTRAPFCLDNILYNAHQRFKDHTGFELRALGELEFFLLSDPEPRTFMPNRQKGYHQSAPFSKSAPITTEMMRQIAQITGAIKYAHHEVGFVEQVQSEMDQIQGKQAEQWEIEFLPTPVDETADFLVLARWLIRNIAYKHGCIATFAPKLEEGIAGNGYHFHMELVKEGKNQMTEAGGKLTSGAKQLIGGLCTYADSLMAFGNTVSSAYLRLVPNQEAPTRICWSDSNRSAMVRVPLGWNQSSNLAQIINPQQKESIEWESRQTVEIRTPDGSALTHLLLAGITMAATWGLTSKESEKVADTHYVKGNIFENQVLLNRLESLPQSCVESAKILMRKRELYEKDGIFPRNIIDYMVKLLKEENDQNMNQILAEMPADERLHETHRIMHKDLHRH